MFTTPSHLSDPARARSPTKPEAPAAKAMLVDGKGAILVVGSLDQARAFALGVVPGSWQVPSEVREVDLRGGFVMPVGRRAVSLSQAGLTSVVGSAGLLASLVHRQQVAGKPLCGRGVAVPPQHALESDSHLTIQPVVGPCVLSRLGGPPLLSIAEPEVWLCALNCWTDAPGGGAVLVLSEAAGVD